MPRNVIVIPARMTSARLPNKPLLEAAGKPLLQWTYDRATQTQADMVFVTTPDQPIIDYCRANKIRCLRTVDDLPTGTHRVAEAIRQLPDQMQDGLDCVVNLQVDEPFIEPDWIDSLFELFPGTAVQTVMAPLQDQAANMNAVKVIASFGRCHWFTRCPVPLAGYHVGVYAFPPKMLDELGGISPTAYSTQESLEQLAWLEYGHLVKGIYVPRAPLSVNTQEDWDEFKRMVEAA